MSNLTYPPNLKPISNTGLPVNSSGVLFDGILMNNGVISKTINIPAGNHYAYSDTAIYLEIGNKAFSIPANILTNINISISEKSRVNINSVFFVNTQTPTTWAASTFSFSNTQGFGSVSWGPAGFVLRPYNGTDGGISTDGLTWTRVSSVNTFATASQDKYVTMGFNGNYIPQYSTDGVNWQNGTGVSASLNNYSRSIAYGSNKFVAIGYMSGINTYIPALTSTDGISWTYTTYPVSAPGAGSVSFGPMTYGNSVYFAADSTLNKNRGVSTTDGVTWTYRTLPSSTNWFASAFGNGTFVILSGYSNSSADAAISTDAVTWTKTTLPSNIFWYGLAYGNGLFVATGNSTSAISTNGVLWTTIAMPSSIVYGPTAYGAGKFISVYSANGVAAYLSAPKPSSPIQFGLYQGPKAVF